MEKQFSNVLKADDIARAVEFAIDQPGHVAINELTIRPFK
jgi:NADP-dependent 3-hydroxy acid dehydrogenase YdfG